MLMLFLLALTILVLATAAAMVHAMLHPPRRTLGWALARNVPADPGQLGLQYVETTFRMADGSESPGWVIAGSNAHGPVVVISHGYAASRFAALAWVDPVRAHACAVAVFDHRGHGDSTACRSEAGATEASDIPGIIQQTRQTIIDGDDRVGDRRAVVLGTSMGAGIALAAAANDTTGDIAGVIAVGAYRYRGEAMAGWMWEKRWPPYPVTWIANAILSLVVGTERAYDRVALAGRIRVPVLVMHGGRDTRCPIASARAIAAAAPNAEIVEFPNAGHRAVAASDPERYRNALSRFFTRVELAVAADRPAAMEHEA